MEVELVKWDPQLATSSVEATAISNGWDPHYRCSLPSSWIKSHERFEEFNSRSPYISPYRNDWEHEEKHTVGMVHELLSLTLWKKLSIMKLEHFKREFKLPEQLNRLLLRHPGIFYVSNRCSVLLPSMILCCLVVCLSVLYKCLLIFYLSRTKDFQFWPVCAG